MAQLPGAVYATDELGRLLYVSDQVELLVGTSAAQLISTGQVWTSLLHPEDGPLVQEQLGEAATMAAGAVPVLEYRVAHPDGSFAWVRDHAVELVERGRRIRQGVLIDVTSQHVAEESLTELEARYNSMLDDHEQSTLTVNLDARITFVSEPARRLINSESELIGLPIEQVVHAVDRKRVTTALQQALSNAEPRIKLRIAAPDGSWVWMSAAARANAGPDGVTDGVELVLSDVAEPEQVSADLIAAERMLTVMLDSVDEGFIVQTADGEMLALNKRARELLGPLGTARDGLPPGWTLLDDGGLPISPAVGPTRAVLTSDQPMSGRIQVQRGDGQTVWLAIDCRPLHRGGEAKPYAALASFADVTSSDRDGTDRKALEVEQERRRRAEDIAERLRAIFVPTPPPPTLGVSLASRYLPATEGVSGDWHEAIALPDGSLGLAIGDVTGHGIEAAAEMGTLRAALRAYALEMYEPHVVLERLNLILRQSRVRMASVLYAILDSDEGVVRFASAGHPPIMLLTPGGEVRFLQTGRSSLLGHDTREERRQGVASLEPGSTLLMYTDGIFETGARSVDESLERLAQRVGEAAAAGLSLEELCARVLPDAADREDDAALFACHLASTDQPRLDLQLDADPDQLRVLRQVLRRWLSRFELGQEDGFQLLLAVDEAARNAVEHAYGLESGTFLVNADHTDDAVTITISDAGRWRPLGRRRRGRGISLMRKLVDEMTIVDLDPGTEVRLTRRLRNG
jgi:PAS domain S-box-containing protein